MPVGKILPAPWNYKEQDEATSAKLLDNLKRNGQVETCIVRTHPTKRGYYEMVNGNHRLDLFMAAGIEQVHCFNLGKVSQQEAERVAIETNETKFDADPVRLAQLVTGLLGTFERDDLLSTLPYSDNELDNFKDLLDFEWEKPDPKTPKEGPGALKLLLDSEAKDVWEQVVEAFTAKHPEADANEVFVSMCAHVLKATNWPPATSSAAK